MAIPMKTVSKPTSNKGQNPHIHLIVTIRSFIRIPAAVRRQYGGSTVAVPWQYRDKTYIRLLIHFSMNFLFCLIKLSIKNTIEDKINYRGSTAAVP